MGLSEENRTLLQLVLGRGKSYADISGLLGIPEPDVRARAQAALAELDPSLPEPDAAVTDYLLGQADAIAKADVQRRIADDPQTADAVGAYSDQLRLLVPGAGTPTVAPVAATSSFPSLGGSVPAAEPATRPEAEPKAPRAPRAPLTGPQRRLIAILLGAALLAGILILILTGVIGGSDDGDEPSGSPAPTVARLDAAPGQNGKGTAQFGFSGANLATNLQITGLDPSRKGESYAVWLYGSTGAFPLYSTRVNRSGSFSGQLTLDEAIICLIAADVFPEMRVSRAKDSALKELQRKVSQSDNPKIPDYVGTTVLEGKISMPQEAKDQIVPNCNGSTAAATGTTE